MYRKTALLILSLLFALGSLTGAPASSEQPAAREIAVTFDDLPFGGRNPGLERVRAANEAIVKVLRQEGVPAIGFVNEGKLFVPGEVDERTALLERWLDAGAELGNHTFSHLSLQTTPLKAFQEDVIRGETVTRWLLEKRGRKLRYFRHPFLRTGPDRETRKAFEAFLADRGYTVAPVTIENADYVFSAIYSQARTKGDAELMRRTGETYVQLTAAKVAFFEEAARQVVGHPIRHVLLLHANEINADYLDDILILLRQRGYRFVSLEEALRDDAYRLPETYAGPIGVSWLYRWAVSRGVKFDWRLEPEPSEAIQKQYEETRSSTR